MTHSSPSWLLSRLVRTSICGFAAAISLLSFVAAARADVYWQVQSGDWSSAANWGGSLPSSSDTAYIVNGGTASITLPGEACGTVSVGNNAGSGSVQMTGGSLAVAKRAYVGYFGTGTFAQSGGTNTFSSNGSLDVGCGSGSSGTYSLSGTGQLSTYWENVGWYHGTGNFTQSGGINTVAYRFELGYGGSGSYSLSGTGQLSAEQEIVGWSSGTGNFTQFGGTNTTGQLEIGLDSGSSGAYSLGGTGQLFAGWLFVGDSGTGTFTQSGGTNTAGILSIAYDSGSIGNEGRGTYYLNGGVLNVSDLYTNGHNGSGTAAFHFSGGTLRASASFTIKSVANFSLTSDTGGATLDTNGYTLTVNQGISGSGGLTKIGSGTLVLAGSNSYTGPTNINTGALKLAGAFANNIATSPTISINSGATLDVTGLSGGWITLANGQTLAGSGTVAGGVVAANGSHVGPGIGTLTVGSLNMLSGSIYDYQFNSTPANGLIKVNTATGLTINGGGFNLYNQGTTTPFATPGTYKLLQYSGAISGNGTSALSVLNPLPGRTYAFSASTGEMDLTIQPATPTPPSVRPDPPTVSPPPSGATGLVCVVPGWQSDPAGWANTMKEDIKTKLSAAGESANWVVEAQGWYDPAKMGWLAGGPHDPLRGATLAAIAGPGFGEEVKDAGYKKVHFIAHSDGAWFIDAATKKLKELDPTIEVQCTFLDPCVGALWLGELTLGEDANYAENYYSTKDWWFTNSSLDHAYNFNVTNVADKVAQNADHDWPYKWYGQTVNTAGWEYGYGYGFPISMEMNGGALPTISDPAKGGIKVLPPGTAADGPALPLARTDTALDFDNLAMYQSDSGTKMIEGTKLTMTTGSPVWMTSLLTVTQPVNFVEFQADFTSAAGAEGLLTIYWVGQPIGLIDERWVLDGMQDYVFALPDTFNVGTYDLSFRLDPYTDTPSSVLIDNAATGYVVPEPSTIILGFTGVVCLLLLAWRHGRSRVGYALA